MKKFFPLVFLVLFLGSRMQAQMVSYVLQQSFTVNQLDSFLSGTGFNLPVSPQYAVDVYQVIYKTPYKHIDSLVNASGIVVFPKNTPCPSALGCYAHGTFTKRTQVPSYEGPERPIGFFFAGIGGVVTAMPDELGLGDSDSSIIIHPYINAFHSGYASVNLMRAARQLADTLSIPLSGEVVLTGYSQGGYTTMATTKLIQEHFSGEFNVVASAPMSGPYDLKKTMVEVMLDTIPYSVPSYLPYLLLGYHSVYPQLQQLFPNPAEIFKSPYDSILPPLYYGKNHTTSQIDNFCHPVPRKMIKDSIIHAFESDTLHPLRLILAENDLLGWAPQKPVKIHYCIGDLQVTYLNALRADSAWKSQGAPDVQSQNFGNLDHGPCVQPALTSAAFFLLGKLSGCTGINHPSEITFRIFPNPASERIAVVKEEGAYEFTLYDVNGKQVYSRRLLNAIEYIELGNLAAGIYAATLRNNHGATVYRKMIVR